MEFEILGYTLAAFLLLLLFNALIPLKKPDEMPREEYPHDNTFTI
ncbi:MAG: hypothetical protein V1644_00930 [Candidatus Micrarchaeota archaeon]